jgi:uncharacterized protein (TIGR00375 family)
MVTGEICTVYEQENKSRKVHHLFYLPSIEVAEQLIDVFSKKFDLTSDGRPIFNNMTSAEFVETIIEVCKNAIILPAHVWTSWFGALGGMSGFDSLEECYQDKIKNILAIETGLSSDPAMNWRLSQLDRFAIMSNSDAHSANPWRLGREANVFDLKEISFKEIYDVIKHKDKDKFLYTIEVDPNYGKYHYTGHRNCNVCLHPKEAKKLNNICPKCKRKMTIGVLQRVEELADREEGFVPKDAIPFKTLLPLYEIISFSTGTNALYSKKIFETHNKLLDRFGNELKVLLEVPREELQKVVGEKITNAIIAVREGKVRYSPGFDGEYGKAIFDENVLIKKTFVDQKSLSDFDKGP